MSVPPILWGMNSVMLCYKNQRGTRTAEFMELSPAGKVARVVANYINEQTGSFSVVPAEPIKQFLPHALADFSVVGFSMVVRAECRNIAVRIRTTFREWNDMMSFEKDSSIRHLKTRLRTPLASTIRS